MLHTFNITNTCVILTLRRSKEERIMGRDLISFFAFCLNVTTKIGRRFLIMERMNGQLILFCSINVLCLITLMIRRNDQALSSCIRIFYRGSLLIIVMEGRRSTMNLNAFRRARFTKYILLTLRIREYLNNMRDNRLLIISEDLSIFLSRFLLRIISNEGA